MANDQQTNPQASPKSQQSNTAVLEPQGDTMTLGDFMSQNATPEQATQPKDVMTLDDFNNGTVTQHQDTKPLAPEHKIGFVKGLGMRLYAGMEEGSANLLEFVGLGDLDKGAIEKSRKIAGDIYKQTDSDNFGIKQANELARSFGELGVTLPMDIMTGATSKVALAGKVLPAVESALSNLPDFALGSGWRGLQESLQKSIKAGESPISAVPKAIGQAGANVALNAAYAASGTGWSGIGKMAAIGGSMAAADALGKGRYPTKEEMASGVAQGAAYGVIFTLLPHLAQGSKLGPEQTAIKGYQDIIDIQMKEGDFQGVKDTVEVMGKDPDIRPEIRVVVDKTLETSQKPHYQGQIDEKGKISWKPIESPIEAPVEGEPPVIKTSELSKNVLADAIKAGLKEEQVNKGELPTHEVRNTDDVGARASEFINQNHDLAMKIAKGEAPEQDDLRAQELYTALRIKAQVEGDVETLMELARSDKAAAMATELGQRVKALDAHDPNDVVKSIREVNKSRELESKKQSKKITSEKKKVSGIIEKAIKKENSKIKTWKELVETIRCK
jgi:hypothetical protein